LNFCWRPDSRNLDDDSVVAEEAWLVNPVASNPAPIMVFRRKILLFVVIIVLFRLELKPKIQFPVCENNGFYHLIED